MPLAYFFATTNKPALKLMLAIMLIVVTGGAFDGYFTATERLIAMRLEEITRYATRGGRCQSKALPRRRRGGTGALAQQREESAGLAQQRADLNEKVAKIDKQIDAIIANQAADKATHKENNARIESMCKAVSYVCMGPKMSEEMARHQGAQTDFAKDLEQRRAEKAQLNSATAEKKEDKTNTGRLPMPR